DRVDAPARPAHTNFGDPCRIAKPESHRQLALRTIAGTGLDELPSAATPRQSNLDTGANPVAVRLCPDRLHAQCVPTIAAVVPQQARGPVILGDQQIEIPVVVEVRVGRATTDDRPPYGGAELIRDLFESAAASIPEYVRRLRVRDVRLHAIDVVGHVTVDGEDVRPSVQIEVEEE